MKLLLWYNGGKVTHACQSFPKTHGNEFCVTRNHLLCYIFSSLVCFSIWNLLSESTPAASPFVVYRCYSSSNPVADIGNFNDGDAINFRALWINAKCVIPKFKKCPKSWPKLEKFYYLSNYGVYYGTIRIFL